MADIILDIAGENEIILNVEEENEIFINVLDTNEIILNIDDFTCSFNDLLDSPNNYTNSAGMFLKVNSTEDGIEYVDSSSATIWGDITGTLSNQADLQVALDSKSNTHLHPYLSDTTITISPQQSADIIANNSKVGITTPQSDAIISNTAKNSYPVADSIKLASVEDNANNYSHPVSHVISDVTNLQTELDNKSTTHIHPYESANTNIQTHIASSHAPATAEENVQSNWDAITGDELILNKPTIPTTPGEVGLGNVLNIDTTNASNITTGTLSNSILPPLAISKTQSAINEASHLSLATQEGDVVVRSDLNKSYIHNGGALGTMVDFTELLTPTDTVLSVAGKVGVINLEKSDVGLSNVDNTSDINKPINTATQTALDNKSNTHTHPYSSDTHNHTGDYEPIKGVDDNFVTDAEKITIGNTSGLNTGDQDISAIATNTSAIALNTTHKDSAHAPSNAEANQNFGTTTGTTCQGNDSRLSDSRTPTSHNQTASTITDFDTEVSNNTDVAANTLKTSYSKTNVMGQVVHGAVASTARPSGFDVVTWIGTVEPTNAINNDIWVDST